MRSVHRDAGAGLYRLPARVTTRRIREGGLIGLLCSQRAHDQNALPQCAQWETDSGFPPGKLTSELGGTQEMQRGLSVMRGIESDIESGLSRSQAKQFALAGAVFDPLDGGVGHYI